MYVALKYIGGKYTPGEIIPGDLPTDNVKWLLEAGAIREVTPAPFVPVDDKKTPPELTKEPPAPNKDADTSDDENDAENAADEEAEDESDDDAEIPEIDVMDGLVAEEETPEPEDKPVIVKPAKKTTERRKSK